MKNLGKAHTGLKYSKPRHFHNHTFHTSQYADPLLFHTSPICLPCLALIKRKISRKQLINK